VNLVLVGFMGCGKSTLGQAVAEELRLVFVDSDALVEARAGMSIRAIFESRGEAEFRRLERETLLSLCQERDLVIATGGGAFAMEEIAQALLDSGLVVYLKAPFDVLWERIKGDPERPLLAGEGAYERARSLFERRRPLYERAHKSVDAARSVDEVTRELVEVYHAWRKRGDEPQSGAGRAKL